MTTARHAAPTPDKQRRRTKRRRRIGREELFAVGVLLAILVVTVVLLGLKWLDAGSATTTVGHVPHLFLEVPA